MTVGFVMLCHEALDRAAQVAGYWARAGCPVVLHVDARVGQRDYDALVAAVSGYRDVRFSRRLRCEWGTWSLVEATQAAAEMLLAEFPRASHVFLASGACLPLRPVAELNAYLGARPGTDFIESVTTEDVAWAAGGLDRERFSLRFPFAWKRHRRLFDAYVELQRRLRVARTIPEGLVPHLGAQWWCLRRETLTAILSDPARPQIDRYFRRVWIPDESYFQTLVRRHGARVESRSLTLAKFDYQGKPHVFYDDHLQLLRDSNCFVARKIWPRADRLYHAFLNEAAQAQSAAEPRPDKIDRLFLRAVRRRTRGRGGLCMVSRFPRDGWENGRSSNPYSVIEGLGELFHDFPDWLRRETGAQVHGHLFAPGRAEFAGGERHFAGALSDSAALRDYRPEAFLTSLIWNTRGERQCFLFGPRDTQRIGHWVAADPNADITVVSGAWAVPLFLSGRPVAKVRKEAARLQKIEARHLNHLRRHQVRARVRIWTLADFVETPMEPLRSVLDGIGRRSAPRLTEAPRMVDLAGFGAFLQALRNEGMHPHLMGDFPVEPAAASPRPGRAAPTDDDRPHVAL